MPTVTIDLASITKDYIDRCIQLGVFSGTLGSESIATNVQPLITGLHHVLAGGTVTVSIDTQGTQTIVDELDGLLDDGIKEANDLNTAAGSRVTIIA